MPLVSRASTVVVLQFGFPKPYLRDSVSLLARRALVATLRRLPCNRSSHRSACAAARPSGRSALRDQSHGSTSLSAPGYAREERDQRRAGLPTGVRLAQLTSPRVRSPTGTARQVGRSATPPPHQRSARASGRPSRQPPSRRTFGSPPARGRACARATGAPGRSAGRAATAPPVDARLRRRPTRYHRHQARHRAASRPAAALARAPAAPIRPSGFTPGSLTHASARNSRRRRATHCAFQPLGYAPLSSGGAGLGIFTPADPNSSVRPRALTRRPRRRPFQGYRLRRRAPGIDPRPAAQPRPR